MGLAGLVSLKDQCGGNRNLSGPGVAIRLKEFDFGFNPLEDDRPMGAPPVLTVAGWDDQELLRCPADPPVRVEQGFKADAVKPLGGGRPRPFQFSKQCPFKRPPTSINTRPLRFSSSADRSIPCTAQLHRGCGRGVRDGTHARLRKA